MADLPLLLMACLHIAAELTGSNRLLKCPDVKSLHYYRHLMYLAKLELTYRQFLLQ